MAIERKRKRSVSNGVKNGKVNHKKFKSEKKTKKNKSFLKRQADRGDGTNVVATYQIKKGKRVAKEGNRKKVKVSKSLRAKINKVLDKDACQGWFKEIEARSNPIGFTSHVQTVSYLYQNSNTGGNEGVPMFSPESVRQAASALYLGFSPTSLGGVPGSVGLFPTDTLKVHVVESNVVYNLRNNTGRTLNIRLFDVSPKGALAGSVGSDDPNDPIAYWTQSLANQVPGVDNDIGTNPLSNTPTVLTMSPKMDAGFMKHFSVDETIIKLEPGKEYYHKVPGVKNMLYDFAKFSVAGVYSNHQKMNKWTFMTGYVDLVSRDAPSTQLGHGTNIDTILGYGLLCETTLFTRFKMPEQAGLKVPTLPVAGQSLNLGYRRNAYAIKHYQGTWTDSTLNIIQDENPGDPVLLAGAT